MYIGLAPSARLASARVYVLCACAYIIIRRPAQTKICVIPRFAIVFTIVNCGSSVFSCGTAAVSHHNSIIYFKASRKVEILPPNILLPREHADEQWRFILTFVEVSLESLLYRLIM